MVSSSVLANACVFMLVLIATSESSLVWISVDGLGKSMVTPKNTPFLHKLSQQAATSLKHQPNYITKTFPNHFSAATGLSVEDHQIVGNHMLDPKLGWFNYSNNDPAWWNPNGNTYPIWTLNEMHNRLGSAVVFWPGSSVPYGKGKIYPKYHTPVYEFSCECSCRIERANSLMKSRLYGLVMVYIDDIDQTGHTHGTKSSRFIQTLRRVDGILERFFRNISNDNSLSDWNLIISSDHGMIDLDRSKTILLSSILPSTIKYTVVVSGSQGQLFLHNKSDVDTTIQVLSRQPGVHKVATPETMPIQYKYSKSNRIPDITVIMKEGWAVAKDEFTLNEMVIGDHGYPSSIAPSMCAILMGYGKDFRKNVQLPETKMTDLFGIACFILKLDSHCAIDQSAKQRVRTLVSTTPDNQGQSTNYYTADESQWNLESFFVLSLLISCVGWVYLYFFWWRRRQKCSYSPMKHVS